MNIYLLTFWTFESRNFENIKIQINSDEKYLQTNDDLNHRNQHITKPNQMLLIFNKDNSIWKLFWFFLLIIDNHDILFTTDRFAFFDINQFHKANDFEFTIIISIYTILPLVVSLLFFLYTTNIHSKNYILLIWISFQNFYKKLFTIYKCLYLSQFFPNIFPAFASYSPVYPNIKAAKLHLIPIYFQRYIYHKIYSIYSQLNSR